MAVDIDDAVHPVTVDKEGNEVSLDVACAVEALRDHDEAYMVLCSWAVSGRIQFFAERDRITGGVIRTARESGYRLDHATTRAKNGSRRGYAEFIPAEHIDNGEVA